MGQGPYLLFTLAPITVSDTFQGFNKYMLNEYNSQALKLPKNCTHYFFHHIYFLHQGSNMAHRNREEIQALFQTSFHSFGGWKEENTPSHMILYLEY